MSKFCNKRWELKNKRIKAEKNNIQEGYNSKIADMNSRIDRILKLERDRA